MILNWLLIIVAVNGNVTITKMIDDKSCIRVAQMLRHNVPEFTDIMCIAGDEEPAYDKKVR